MNDEQLSSVLDQIMQGSPGCDAAAADSISDLQASSDNSPASDASSERTQPRQLQVIATMLRQDKRSAAQPSQQQFCSCSAVPAAARLCMRPHETGRDRLAHGLREHHAKGLSLAD